MPAALARSKKSASSAKRSGANPSAVAIERRMTNVPPTAHCSMGIRCAGLCRSGTIGEPSTMTPPWKKSTVGCSTMYRDRTSKCSGRYWSSESRKVTNAPSASRTPVWRAAPVPRLDCTTSRMRSSRSTKGRTISAVRSLLPSSTMMSSQRCSVCCRTDSIARSMHHARL